MLLVILTGKYYVTSYKLLDSKKNNKQTYHLLRSANCGGLYPLLDIINNALQNKYKSNLWKTNNFMSTAHTKHYACITH